MSNKITKIYLSALIFFLSFFCIYSLRYSIYDFLDSHNLYEDTLTQKQIQDTTKYLNQDFDFANYQQTKKELNRYLGSGSFQVLLYKTNHHKLVVDSVYIIQGRAPSSILQKYRVEIKGNQKYMVEWYPSFSQYYFYYRIFNFVLSLLISIGFFFLINQIPPYSSKKNFFHSLSSKMTFTFFLATCIVISIFCFLYLNRNIVFDFIMDTFYQSENYDDYASKVQKDLRYFSLTKENKKTIKEVLKSDSLNHAYAYIYDSDDVYYAGKTSIDQDTFYFFDTDNENPLYYDYSLQLKDQEASLIINSFPLVQYQIPYIIIIILIAFSFYMILLQGFIRKRVQSIQTLQADVFSLAIGNWNHEIQVNDHDEIGRLAEDLNQMRITFLRTMDNEQQARVANKELISSLSHDLRTPLTTLKGYLEIMNLKKDDIEFRNQYLQKCLDKVEEITYLSNKMFEYSLVFSTEYNAEIKDVPLQKIINTISDHIQYLKEMDLHVLYEPIDSNLHIQANFAMMQRILNNIFSNIQKYCDPWKDIIVQVRIEDNQLKMSFTNSINHHLEKVESNGIGLKSVQKMVELHHGSFYKTQTNDIFTITLCFKLE